MRKVKEKFKHVTRFLRGKGGGGVPLVQIMENGFQCLADRRGLGGDFSEEFVKICIVTTSRTPFIYRRQRVHPSIAILLRFPDIM